MRFLLGVVFGVLLIVGAAFIADSLATAEGTACAEPRQIVNWDVAGDRLISQRRSAPGLTSSQADCGELATTEVATMQDTTIKKVEAGSSPRGEMGQRYLVAGKRVSKGAAPRGV
jgi:hypothetical protein